MKTNFSQTAKPEASRKIFIPRVAFCARGFIVRLA
jgi:hypothetical protein